MSDYFFTDPAGQSVGPLPENEMRRLLQVGEITLATLVCQDGWTKWEPAGKIFTSLPAVPVAQYTAVPQKPNVNGLIRSGWVCFLLGIALVFVPFPLFWIYGPLLITSLILSVVVLARGYTARGLFIMLTTLLVSPICILISWMLFVGSAVKSFHDAMATFAPITFAPIASYNGDVQSAARGDAGGEYRMGVRYLTGHNVDTDPVKAREFLAKSAAQGNQDAAAALAKLPTP